MKTNAEFCSMLLVLVAGVVIMGGLSPAFSGGPGPEERTPLSNGSDQKLAGNVEAKALVICTEPRPQICTREYRPVCAQLADASFKTYATGCTACSDLNVSGYRDGACQEGR